MPLKESLTTLRYALEAALFFVAMGVFRLIGLQRASAAGGAIARTLGPLLPVTRRARRNLDLCFPDMPETEKRGIIREMYDNLGRTFGEYAHLDRFDIYLDAPGHIAVERFDIVDDVAQQGKGGIFFSGHFANWEVLPLSVSGRGLTGGEVYRAANNPYINGWILKRRSAWIFPEQIPKGAGGARSMLSVLKRKQHICMLVDQKLNDGIAVPFFGHEAMTSSAAAQLALHFDCPLVPVGIVREAGPHFRITVYPPLALPRSGDKAADVQALTRQMNQWLEERIRETPSQWLWLHNRWPPAAYQSSGRSAPSAGVSGMGPTSKSGSI